MAALDTPRRCGSTAGRFVTLSITPALVAGRKARDASVAAKPTNTQTWAPDKLTSVQDVPATEIETLIQNQLDGPIPDSRIH